MPMVQDLTTSIMRRVYVIWFARQIFNTLTVKAGLVALLVWQLFSRVSVTDIVANWHPDWGVATSYAFVRSAITQTELATQILLVSIAVVAVFMVRDLVMRRRPLHYRKALARA